MDSQNSTGSKQADKSTPLQTCTPLFKKNGKMTEDRALDVSGEDSAQIVGPLATEEYSQPLKSNEVYTTGFQDQLKLVILFTLSFSPFWSENVTIILCLCHHYNQRRGDVFSSPQVLW